MRIVWPEEAGIGAAPASRAKAASEWTRPWCDQESTTCAAAWGPTPGWSSSCGASLRVSVSISRASSRSSAVSCSTPAGDRTEREQAAAQLWIARIVSCSPSAEVKRRDRLGGLIHEYNYAA